MYWSARRRSPARAYTAASAYLKRGVSSSSGVSVFCKWLTASANSPGARGVWQGENEQDGNSSHRLFLSSEHLPALRFSGGGCQKAGARDSPLSHPLAVFTLCARLEAETQAEAEPPLILTSRQDLSQAVQLQRAIRMLPRASALSEANQLRLAGSVSG